MEEAITINGRAVDSARPYIIAEIGSNHDGKLAQAKQLIASAAAAGADAVKFQTFKADRHYSKYTPGFSYLDKNERGTYELIRSLELNREWHTVLMAYAAKHGVTFLSSPCDKEAVDLLGQLDMKAFKVASFDLTDGDLIARMASFQKPMILSTGMADYGDIQWAVNRCRKEGNDKIILLQCTSLYPAPVHLSNLTAMKSLQDTFQVPVGYSDHTLGTHVSIAAAALGACVIEKHFTLDKTLPGPDHPFAVEPEELKTMIAAIRDIGKSLGDGVKNGPRKEEEEMYWKGRRSLQATRNLQAGERLTKADLCVKRPGYGISPRFMEEVNGMVLTQTIKADHWITWEDFK